MCFSAEASFIVGGTLTIIGTQIIRKVKDRKDLPVALIPMIFAIQQITEGLLWVALAQNNLQVQFWLSNLYGVFVGILWPLYVPFAIYCTEIDHRRKKIIALIGLSGITLAFYTAWSIAVQPITAEIIDNHIYYEHDMHVYPLIILLYLLATCVPFFLTSFRNLHLSGMVITIGFFIAFLVYTKTFVSVWCFFAAIASALILLYFNKRKQRPLLRVP